jgi:hypothetical protein
VERQIWVRDVKFVVNRIVHIPKGESEQEFDRKLAERLRMAPLGPQSRNPDDPQDTGTYDVPFLQLPGIENKFEDLKKQVLVQDPVEIRDFARAPGIYELRFTADFYHELEGRDNAKPVDVGIRFAVLPAGFKVRVLDFTTRRAD